MCNVAHEVLKLGEAQLFSFMIVHLGLYPCSLQCPWLIVQEYFLSHLVHFVKVSLNSFKIHLSAVLGAWDRFPMRMDKTGEFNSLFHWSDSVMHVENTEGAQGPGGGDPTPSSRLFLP